MQYIVSEEDRDKTLDALSHLEIENGLLIKESSPSSLAVEFLKTYIKELFSRDTWIESRRLTYEEDLDRSTATEKNATESQKNHGLEYDGA